MVAITQNVKRNLCEVTFMPEIQGKLEVEDLLEAAAGFLRRNPDAFPTALQLTYDEMCGFYVSLFISGEPVSWK